MTRENLGKLLAMIDAAYPHFKPTNDEILFETWWLALSDENDTNIAIAFKTYLKSNNDGYPPSPGQLIDLARRINEPQITNEQEAWALVRKAISNGTYYSQREFEALPDLVQKAVGDANQLYVWATDENYNESVISSHFINAYKTLCARREEYNRMPKEARARIDALQKQALGTTERVMIGDNKGEV